MWKQFATIISPLSIAYSQTVKLTIAKGLIAECQLNMESEVSWQPCDVTEVQEALIGGCLATESVVAMPL